MEMVKFFTSEMFRKQEFVNMLEQKMNVRAYAVKDGVILDREAFNDVPLSLIPHWAFINRKFINSQFHTRPAEPAEIPAYGEYQLAIVGVDSISYVLKGSKAELIKQADEYAAILQAAREIVIIDSQTGEVVHEVEL